MIAIFYKPTDGEQWFGSYGEDFTITFLKTKEQVVEFFVTKLWESYYDSKSGHKDDNSDSCKCILINETNALEFERSLDESKIGNMNCINNFWNYGDVYNLFALDVEDELKKRSTELQLEYKRNQDIKQQSINEEKKNKQFAEIQQFLIENPDMKDRFKDFII